MKYELVFLLSPKLSEEEAKKEAAALQEKMEQKGAKVEREDFWGRRKLAYEIKHLSHAYYVLVIFEAEDSVSNDINAMFNIEKEVIRHIIVKYEGETNVSLKEDDSEEKLVPQKKEEAEPKKEEKEEKAPAKKEEKKEEKKVESKKEDDKKEDSEESSEDLDKKLDEILDKI